MEKVVDISDAEIVGNVEKHSGVCNTPEIDPQQALMNLATAAKMASMTYDQHALCEKSFNVLHKFMGYGDAHKVI